MTEEMDDIHSVEGVLLQMEVELTLGGNGTDRREMIAATDFRKNGGLAARCPSIPHRGQQVKGGFVQTDEGAVFLAYFF